jgi:hypothetical protein
MISLIELFNSETGDVEIVAINPDYISSIENDGRNAQIVYMNNGRKYRWGGDLASFFDAVYNVDNVISMEPEARPTFAEIMAGLEDAAIKGLMLDD